MLFTVTLWGIVGYQEFYKDSGPTLGENILLTKVSSIIYGEDRDIIIRLPIGYGASDVAYPLIVKMDGFSHLTLHDEILTQLRMAGHGPDAIIVAIPSKAGQRLRELTPTGWTLRGYDGVVGEGDRFLEFVTQDVIPFVRSNYRTGNQTYLTGNSLGGLAAVYGVIRYPEIFEGGFAFAPSFWANNQQIVRLLEESLQNGTWSGKFLFMALGDQEPASMTRPYAAVLDALSRDAPPDLRWQAHVIAGGTHASTQIATLAQAYHLWGIGQNQNR